MSDNAIRSPRNENEYLAKQFFKSTIKKSLSKLSTTPTSRNQRCIDGSLRVGRSRIRIPTWRDCGASFMIAKSSPYAGLGTADICCCSGSYGLLPLLAFLICYVCPDSIWAFAASCVDALKFKKHFRVLQHFETVLFIPPPITGTNIRTQ